MRRRFQRRLLTVVLLLGVTTGLTFLPVASAQQPPPPSEPDVIMRVNVDLVVLPVSVTDDRYRAYGGLQAENFQVYENGVRQKITNVEEKDSPISVGLVFDASGSVTPSIEICRAAVRTFFRFANPEDEYFLIEFSSRPVLLVPFTSESNQILRHVGAARTGGRTALYDAVYRALAEMQKARHQRRVLLILSDGIDNFSTFTERDIQSVLARMENSVQIYTLGVTQVGNFQLLQDMLPREVRMGPVNLARLAEMSGGHSFLLNGPGKLLDTVGRISRELRAQYEVTYQSSSEAGMGEWRSVRVEVQPPSGAPPLEVRTRPGYFAIPRPISSSRQPN